MLVVGLTGGIGSGKSTVSSLLTERGALVVDTDVVARLVVAPGGPAYDALVDRFGPSLASDRRALAGVVFSDPSALADLNAIVHPAVREEVARRLAELRDQAADVVVLAVPLLVETGGAYGVDAVVVVDCPEELAVRRLVEQRGMDEADVRRRMAAQASRDERTAIADVVIHNDASMDDLEAQADETWEWIQALLAESEP
ncbi:MAG: dephospho-CoA kinase [Actinomycetota bacterium]|jgi:dephospho-CoA kinase|nr:dephospho-CoA kinase [Actinomycetota bacterium]MEA3076428.1 dephospho-CoA kinase [Actinomycetota bacterium]